MPSLVSPYEKTGDSRFAPNLLPYIGVRAVFFGVTCAVVRKVYVSSGDRLSDVQKLKKNASVHVRFWSHMQVVTTSYGVGGGGGGEG